MRIRHKQNVSGGFDSKETKPRNAAPFVVMIEQHVLDEIQATVGARPAESGGMLGGDRDRNTVTRYFYDDQAARSRVTYSPDHQNLTSLLREEWNPSGIDLMGFVHSHPRGCRAPSAGDFAYAKRILETNKAMTRLIIPIVMASEDREKYEILPFVAQRDDGGGISIRQAQFQVIGGVRKAHKLIPTEAASACDPGAANQTFSRIAQLYDLPRLQRSRVVSVGVGGAAAFLEDAARSGVGEFVLVDPDVITDTNIATQQAYRRDIGRPKVECVAERIKDINPEADVIQVMSRDDTIDDTAFRRLLLAPLNRAPPAQTLLCGFTDSFHAQARVNRLALNYGIPSLCAQLYEGGSMMELTYTYPGLTAACHRCILASRYKAYLDDGYVNSVGSSGTPIFATGRLNALKGFVAMALLHYDPSALHETGTARARWSNLLRDLDQRNLAWIRTDPRVGGVFDQIFTGASTDNICFDETVWRIQTPDGASSGRPTCPDCSGTGNLLDVIGTYDDTRAMRASAFQGGKA